MITVPFVLSHYSSRHWYKNSLLLINPRLRKLKPVNILILLSVRVIAFWVDCGLCSIKADRKLLYMCKKGHFLGEVRSCPLKIGTSVDEDIEWQSLYQIRNGSIKGQENEKAK